MKDCNNCELLCCNSCVNSKSSSSSIAEKLFSHSLRSILASGDYGYIGRLNTHINDTLRWAMATEEEELPF